MIFTVNIFILNYNFPIWKLISLTGVDLNLQFPAEWYKAREIKFAQGFTSPAPRDFEPETLAVYNYTLSYPFSLVLAYHTQGKEIYWKFQDYLPENSYEIAKRFSDVSRYVLSETPYNSSFAGFKDWFIQNFDRPRLYYRSWFW